MFLLHQRFIGTLLKKYRENAYKSCFLYIQQSLRDMDKIDTTYLVGKCARNLIKVKTNYKKSVLMSIWRHKDVIFAYFCRFWGINYLFNHFGPNNLYRNG